MALHDSRTGRLNTRGHQDRRDENEPGNRFGLTGAKRAIHSGDAKSAKMRTRFMGQWCEKSDSPRRRKERQDKNEVHGPIMGGNCFGLTGAKKAIHRGDAKSAKMRTRFMGQWCEKSDSPRRRKQRQERRASGTSMSTQYSAPISISLLGVRAPMQGATLASRPPPLRESARSLGLSDSSPAPSRPWRLRGDPSSTWAASSRSWHFRGDLSSSSPAN
jgi:hypothetical protein